MALSLKKRSDPVVEKKALPKPAKIRDLVIGYRNVEDLKVDPRNTRTHSKDQLKVLVASLQQFGWTNPILIHKNQIVAGHGRLMAAIELGYKRVPTISLDDMTDTQRRAYVIADNRTAELAGWDTALLKSELSELVMIDKFDLAPIGFDLTAIDYKVKDAKEVTQEFTGIYEMSETADFPFEGKYDFTQLKTDMILDLSKIKRIATWAGNGSEERDADCWWYNFNSDSQVGLDWSRVLLGFYVDDVRFECWWDDTPKYCKQMKDRGIIGATSPNYSTYFDWSKSVRIYNIYRSRWVGRYMQEAGIKIVPDLSCGPDDIEEMCAGLKGIRNIAIQAHQTYDAKTVKMKEKVIDYIMDQVEPETILLYAPGDRLKLFPRLNEARILLVEPRSQVRQRRMKEK